MSDMDRNFDLYMETFEQQTVEAVEYFRRTGFDRAKQLDKCGEMFKLCQEPGAVSHLVAQYVALMGMVVNEQLHDSLTGPEAVRCIRAICAAELDRPFDYPFFQADYRPGEKPDDALVRLFMQERVHHRSDFDTVLVLIHG